jgi:hypothetical protein
MSEPDNEPRAKTEELLQRIERLESENAVLRGKFEALANQFQREADKTTDHIIYLYQQLADYLAPLLHKVFPDGDKVVDTILAIAKKRPGQ